MRRFSDHTLTARITIAISLLAALGLALFSGFALLAARKVDEEALLREKLLVRHALSSIVADVPREQESFSTWDEAVIRAAARDERWIAENFGGWMYRFFGHDRTYILDTRDNLVFAASRGDVMSPPHFAEDEKPARDIVARLRDRMADRFDADGKVRTPRSAIFVTDICEIEGRPAIVSARPILPHTNRIAVADGGEDIFLAVKFLDGPVMSEIARRSLVSELQYVQALSFERRSASVAIASEDGRRIGYFIWTPGRPGLTLIREVAPWALSALLFALCVGFFQARGLRRASAELQASEGRARHLAFHDVLTGLPNRALFEEQLEAILADARHGKGQAAVLLLDLDRFKNVNDTLGHRAGDELVRQAAMRFEDVVRKVGVVARIGGDEFAIALAAENAVEAASLLSARLIAALTPPFRLEEDVAHVGASIGIATAPPTAAQREELLRKADIALYEAKKAGRGRYQLFSDAMDDIVRQRRVLEADLREALNRGGELDLVYQPLFSAGGKPTGAEALLRWNHPMHEAISPAFLIAIAEECGLVMQIGDWILHEACRMAKRVPVPWIAVNVSPVQLRDPGFARRCLDIIACHGISPQRILIELTEAVMIENPEVTGATLRMLRDNGVRVALDDFGTGYSSMSYLKNYPLDRLKIDRFFVRALSEGEEGRAIIAAMIDMARAFKLEVTAEGVETQEQRELLVKMGCSEMQGYLFSCPVSAAALAEIFRPGRANRRA